MYSEDVTSGNGTVKHVVAQSQEELDEAVRAIKAEHSAPAPDILDPRDGNKIVSPDNRHTEDIPSEVDNSVQVKEDEVEDRQAEPVRKAEATKPKAAKSEK